MSAAASSPKRFLLTTSGDILNVDYVVRVYESGGKLFADMVTGPDLELLADAGVIRDLRRMLPLNGGA